VKIDRKLDAEKMAIHEEERRSRSIASLSFRGFPCRILPLVGEVPRVGPGQVWRERAVSPCER
jgi:hypothetical protein